MKRRNLLVLCCLAWLSGLADVVHVFEQTEAGGAIVQIVDRMLDTGRNYKTGAAPAMSGWVFTHWTISTAQDFADRGRRVRHCRAAAGRRVGKRAV